MTVDLGIPGISDAVPVGRGGFGTVYRARQEKIGRTVAVKVLSISALGDEERRRFERECQTLGAVSGHPNIVAIFDSGTSGEQRPYLIMDYLPGGTLAEGLERNGPATWQVAADLGVKLAGALAAAHAAGVLHRDVKPDNVLLSAYGEPQLADFGIARLSGASHSRTGQVTATLAHAAPEVIEGAAATEVSDVYSLASTLYELLSGHAPFVRPTDETLHPVLARLLSEDPPDLRASGHPSTISDVIEAALAKDPAVRTPTAVALAERLQAAQRTLGAAVTPLVTPPIAAVAPAMRVLGVAAGASPVSDPPGEEQATEIRVRGRREPAPEIAVTSGDSRRRRRLLAAALSAAVLVLLVAAYAISTNDRDHATRSLASQVASTTPATTTAPGSTASGPPAAVPHRHRKTTTDTPHHASSNAASPRRTGGGESSSHTATGTSSARPSSPPASTQPARSRTPRKPKAKRKPSRKTPTTPLAPAPTPAQPTAPVPIRPPAATPPAPKPPAPKPPAPRPPAPKPTTFTEQVESAGSAPTFKVYRNASGRGPDIPANGRVQITCKVYDTTIRSVLPGGYWYRIATAPWNNAYYSPANNFLNGGHPFDAAVKNC